MTAPGERTVAVDGKDVPFRHRRRIVLGPSQNDKRADEAYDPHRRQELLMQTSRADLCHQRLLH